MILPSLILGALATTGFAADVRYTLPIVNSLIQPDGFSRTTVLAGGTFPGTLLKAYKGDQFKINVKNQLTDNTMLKSTSIHWHGFFQKGSNEMDGGAFVNQCPITPATSFLYDFSTARQAGTFWYHSHLSTQYCDGLRGPMVVYDRRDPHRHLYDIDNANTVITLADWYHTKALVMPIPAIPESTLINGLGRFDAKPTPLAVIKVVWGLRYRFRIVSLSCEPAFVFSIHGHKLTVIEADSENTQPLTVTSLDVHAGQRYSVILKATQPINNYWIRARPSISTDPGFTNNRHSAILRYVGARDKEPTTVDVPSTNHLLETNLHPLTSPRAPGRPVLGGADVNINLALGFTTAGGGFRFTVNNASFVSPNVPVLLQILSGARQPSELLPKGSIYALPRNKVIELTIPAAGAPGGPHPMHLHGHSFSVVRSAGSSVYNFDNPMRRDVVSAGSGTDNVTIRFTTDNPGPWFLHCHIDWHFELGLSVVFAEDIPDTPQANMVSATWENLCPLYNQLNPDDRRVDGRPALRLSDEEEVAEALGPV